MKKEEIIKHYTNVEDKLLIAKMLDKESERNKTKRLVVTDFLDERQVKIVEKILRIAGIENYEIDGFWKEAERKVVYFYPVGMETYRKEKELEQKVKIMRIELPKEMQGQYSHRDYLGGLMKLGVKREKIGDILVTDSGADIVFLAELEKYLKQNVGMLTRFQKAKISILPKSEIREVKAKKELLRITVMSLRLDNIVAEVGKCSRAKANELLENQKVIVNYEVITKGTKLLKEKDKLTIRGKGKFEIAQILGNNKKGRYILLIEKYV